MPTDALSLPPEIVCSVFLHLVPLELSLERGDGRTSLGWIASATHVCRKWRHIILAFPEIWAQNLCALSSSAATDCFLERAHSAHLVFKPRERMSDHQMTLAHTHLARIHTFDPKWGTVPHSFVEALEAGAWPNLAVLHIDSWEGRDGFTFAQALDAPALRELHLADIFFSRISAPQLRVLSVINMRYKYHGARSAVPEPLLLEVLRGMPLLEWLTLDGAVARDGDDAAQTGTSAVGAELPHLRVLRMREEVHSFGFYGKIHGAAAADVWIEDGECKPARTLSATFAALARHLRVPAYNMLLVHEEHRDDGPYFRLRLRASSSVRAYEESYAEREHEERDDGSAPEFRFDANIHGRDAINSVGFIRALAPYINCTDIEFLDLGCIGDVYLRDYDDWAQIEVEEVRDVLALFSGVTTAQFSIHAERQLVRALQSARAASNDADEDVDSEADDDPGDDHDSNASSGLPLPALHHLVIEGLSDLDTVSCGALKEAWGIVLGILKERKRAGRPIRFLTLTDWERFPGAEENELAELDECDTKYMLRAEELVNEVFDVRGIGEPWDGRRLSEYVQKL